MHLWKHYRAYFTTVVKVDNRQNGKHANCFGTFPHFLCLAKKKKKNCRRYICMKYRTQDVVLYLTQNLCDEDIKA